MGEGEDPGPEFRLLGAFEVVSGGRALDLVGTKQRLLLAMLVLGRNQPVSVDALAEELWGAHPPVNVHGAVQNLVSRVRRLLIGSGWRPDVLVARGTGYVLSTGAGDVDADRFDLLAANGHDLAARGDFGGAAGAFRTALALWRGPALTDLAERPFARAIAAALDESRTEVAEALADTCLAAGSADAAVPVLEALVTSEPFREGASARLMLALYRAGRQADALRVYQQTRSALQEELGLEPGPGLRRLESQILAQSAELDGPGRPLPAVPLVAGTGDAEQPPQVDTRVFGTDLTRPERVFQVGHHDLTGNFPQLAAKAEHPHNLPAPIGRFLGREPVLSAGLAEDDRVTVG